MRKCEANEGSSDEGDLARLMIAYQAGQLDAFESLYGALAADLRRYFGSAQPDGGVVQDLVQETFLEIHRSRRLYLPPLPVRPWVFGVARNVLRRQRRAAWRLTRHEDRTVDPADERLSRAEAAVRPAGIEPRDLEDALSRLPPGRRDAWLLHHLHGLSFQQVAVALRIGVGAAKLRSSRAMKALRSSLGIGPGAPDE
jgi:RNA polymerase sigma-70 factor (ECF subfamily)